MSDMTPKRRMLAALQGEPLDRIAFATYNFHHLNPTFQKPAYKPMLDAWWAAEDCGVLCKTPHQMHGGRRERTRTETHHKGTTVIRTTTVETPKGELREVFATPKGQPGYTVEPFVKDDQDVERLLSLPTEPAQPDLTITKVWHEKLGEKGLNYVAYGDPLYAVNHWFDFEDFCIRCLTQKDLIIELVEREFERIRGELALMLEQAQGYQFLFYTAGPEIATPPMLSPKVFKWGVLEYEQELVRMIRESGQLSAIHCHGRVAMVFDMFKAIGPHALEPLEPPPQGDIALQEALDRAGEMSLMGYIQDQDLYIAEPGEMRQKVAAICEIIKERATLSGYIMTSTATPYMDPPPAAFTRNYIEYLQAAQELGA
jgi:uroporphyrinogen-III decarboxylase